MAKINRVIKILVLSDLALYSASGFLVPIFAIFITDQIEGGDIKVAGFAAAVFWITKSILQLPIGRYLDKNHGEKDDFYFMVFGGFLATLVPFGFIFSRLPWHIYGLQFIYAIGMACTVPPWSAIFTRHIDKSKEAFEWSLEETGMGLGAGITGALGGILASKFGFNMVFITVGIMALISAFILIFVYRFIIPKTKEKIVPKIKKPPV